MTSDVAIEQEIQAKGLTAPRVTLAAVEAEVASEHYFTAQHGVLGMLVADGPSHAAYAQARDAPQALKLLTFCVLVLKNGFTVTGESACASPENFDAELGRKIARRNAEAKIWMLLGFRLRDDLSKATVYRDAGTGVFVSKEFAEAHPNTTVSQKV